MKTNIAQTRTFLGTRLKKLASTVHGVAIPTPAQLLEVTQRLGFSSVADMLTYSSQEEMEVAILKIDAIESGENPDDVKSPAEVLGEGASPDAEAPAREAKNPVAADDPLEAAIAGLRAAAKKSGAVPDEMKDRLSSLEKTAKELAANDKVFADGHNELTKKVSSITPILDAIMAALPTGAPIPPRVVAAVAAATSGGKDRMLNAVLPFFTPGLEQTCAIPAVVSPPSFGKTFMADSIAALYEARYFHPFKDDIDEISALVGVVSPRPDGSLLVADGPLTAAIRSAQSGVKTLFVGDEVFNASRKTLEWMLSTLSPRVHDGERCYILQTRQVEEDGTFEILRAPVTNLHVLFMGNLRASPPEAFASRIQMLRFDFSKEWAMDVCLQRLEYFSGGAFDPSDSATKAFAGKFANLMEATRQKYSTLELARPLCFRFLIAAVQNVCRWNATPTLDHMKEYFTTYLPQQIAVQNAATQDTDAASFKLASELVKHLA